MRIATIHTNRLSAPPPPRCRFLSSLISRIITVYILPLTFTVTQLFSAFLFPPVPASPLLQPIVLLNGSSYPSFLCRAKTLLGNTSFNPSAAAPLAFCYLRYLRCLLFLPLPENSSFLSLLLSLSPRRPISRSLFIFPRLRVLLFLSPLPPRFFFPLVSRRPRPLHSRLSILRVRIAPLKGNARR